jgi:hypothetical protein
MSYMSRNPQVASVVLDDITTTTPGNPPAGKHKIVDRMGNIFVRNSSGAETIIASAAGNSDGEKNYITNPSGAASISGWGNVGDLDIVRTATAAELPREFSTKTGLKITADANAQTVADYVYFDFTLDDVDAAGRIMKLKWDQKVTGTYTAGQLEVVITTQADRTTAVVTPFISAIPASDGTFQTYFLAPSTATASLVIRATADMTTDGGIVISDVVVGPNVQVQGAAIGPWKAFTPTGSWSANTTYTGFYREVGEDVEINVNIALAGAPTSAALTVNMPTGFTINSSKMATTTSAAILGLVSIYDAAPATYEGRILYSSTSAVAVVVEKSDGTYGAYVAVTEAVPQTFANGDKVQLSYKVPVNELSSNVTLANRSVENYGSSTTGTWDAAAATGNTVIGLNGSPVSGSLSAARTKVIRFNESVQSTDSLILEYRIPSTNAWVPSATSEWCPVSWPGITFGGFITSVSGTDVTVYFSQYATAGTTYNSTTGAVNYSAAKYDAWRVRKVSGGASVGYPVSSANIVGRTDGVAPAAGMVGESYQDYVSMTRTSNAAGDGSTRTLQAGRWKVTVCAACVVGTGTEVQSVLSVGGSAGTTQTLDALLVNTSLLAGSYIPIGTFTKIIDVTSATVVKVVNTVTVYTSGTFTFRTTMTSERIA